MNSQQMMEDYDRLARLCEAQDAEINRLNEAIKTREKCSFIGAMRDCPTHGESNQLSEAKATALAYEREVENRGAMKALEDAAKYFESVNDQFVNPDRGVEKTLTRMAAELRTNKGE